MKIVVCRCFPSTGCRGFTSHGGLPHQLFGFHHYTLSEASEASGVTYNWDTGTLFVTLESEGHGVEQYSTSGEFIDRMNL